MLGSALELRIVTLYVAAFPAWSATIVSSRYVPLLADSVKGGFDSL